MYKAMIDGLVVDGVKRRKGELIASSPSDEIFSLLRFGFLKVESMGTAEDGLENKRLTTESKK